MRHAGRRNRPADQDTGYAPPVQVKTTAPLPDLPDDFGDPRGATDGDILPPGVLATLTFESEGDAQPSELDLAASKITVGTDPSCDMQINVDGVAPIHFTIWWRDGGFVISTHAADAVAEIMTTTLGFAGMFAESPDPVTLQPDEPYPLGPEANHTIDIGRPGLHAATLMFIYEES
ncbi:MAG: FHA domain-containing protein [Pseudomonadota bacterium]